MNIAEYDKRLEECTTPKCIHTLTLKASSDKDVTGKELLDFIIKKNDLPLMINFYAKLIDIDGAKVKR